MQYTHINDEDLTVLRHQRLRALEQDHYAALLVLEEQPHDTRTRSEATELERRISHHRSQLLSTTEAAPWESSDIDQSAPSE